jgi:hypothetical protein
LKLTEVYLTAGSLNGQTSAGSHSDYQFLAPGSQILENNPGALDAKSQFYSPYSSSGGFSLQTGIQFLNRENNEYRSNPTLRVGLRYASINQFSDWSTSEDRTAYDTLVGQNTSNIYYLDSVRSKTVRGNYEYEQISIDASLIFRTKDELRWSVYGGVGVRFGLSINAKTSIGYDESEYTNVRGYSNEMSIPTYAYLGSGINESYQNKNSFGGSAYLPLGVDFRIGKDSPFWNMFHLYAEAQPGIMFKNIPEIDRTVVESYLTINSGIRVRW